MEYGEYKIKFSSKKIQDIESYKSSESETHSTCTSIETLEVVTRYYTA